MTFTIRPIVPDANERTQVQRLASRIASMPGSPLGTPPAKSWLEPGNCDVAVDDVGRVLGFNYYRMPKVGESLVITQIAVHPMHRKQGIARALVDAAWRHGRSVITLKVEADNPAVLFYARLGFTRTGTERARTGRLLVSMRLDRSPS